MTKYKVTNKSSSFYNEIGEMSSTSPNTITLYLSGDGIVTFFKDEVTPVIETQTYDYGTHECLDRTFLVMELLSYVQDHPQIVANEKWSGLANKAHAILFELYQSIGERMP